MSDIDTAKVKLTLAQRERAAKKAVMRAAHIIMAGLGDIKSMDTKSSEADLVTNVDLEADAAIREILMEECPHDGLITEETYSHTTQLDLSSAWLVDPIDGTTNFAHTFPTFCVSIAYVENNEVVLGVIFDPCRNELFTAIKGEGAFLNGLPISVTKETNLDKSLLATGFPYLRDGNHPVFQAQMEALKAFLLTCRGIRRLGSAALDLAYVAAGRLDGFWEYHLSPWDVAAGMLLVTEAKGQVSQLDGQPLQLNTPKVTIAASNAAIHDVMVVTAAQAANALV